MTSDIILIGPIGAGKSTVGSLLSTRLNLPQCSMDDLRKSYYEEIGYDEELGKQKREAGGIWGMYEYWKPFEAHAVERLLSEHHECTINFGAGHSVYEDDALFKRVETALLQYPNVVLLLPSIDLDESIKLLQARNELPDEWSHLNEHFVRHPSNHKLAKFTVFTNGKIPEETCDEILSLLGLR
jgi:shikimate kinase